MRVLFYLFFYVDFGFAQYLHSEEEAQTMRGSPLYMVRKLCCALSLTDTPL